MQTQTKEPATRGKLLQLLRQRAGLTMRKLGAKLSVSHVVIGNAERGIVRHMSLEKAIACAKVCGASSAELEQLRALDALDRKALPLPKGTTALDVAAALALINEAIADRKAERAARRKEGAA